jgi:hypothetical protein
MNLNDVKDNIFDKLYKIQKLLKKESALNELCNQYFIILI